MVSYIGRVGSVRTEDQPSASVTNINTLLAMIIVSTLGLKAVFTRKPTADLRNLIRRVKKKAGTPRASRPRT